MRTPCLIIVLTVLPITLRYGHFRFFLSIRFSLLFTNKILRLHKSKGKRYYSPLKQQNELCLHVYMPAERLSESSLWRTNWIHSSRHLRHRQEHRSYG